MTQIPQPVVDLLDDLGQTDLAGDLAEELSAGRSRAWLWWQVGAAIIAALSRTIRQHPYLTVRAVSVGWTTWLLMEGLVRGRVLWFPPSLPLSRFPEWVRDAPSFPLACSAVALMVSGWVVARVHRQHRQALVLVTMLSMALCNAVFIAWRTYEMVTHPPMYAPLMEQRLVLHDAIPFLVPLVIVNTAIMLMLPLLVAVGGAVTRVASCDNPASHH